MADDMRITNFPDSGSKERVAFELMEIIFVGLKYPKDEQTVLDTYARCLKATSGQRIIS